MEEDSYVDLCLLKCLLASDTDKNPFKSAELTTKQRWDKYSIKKFMWRIGIAY